jgi:hypothetical protein
MLVLGTVGIESCRMLHIGPEKHISYFGINRQCFGLQKQIQRWSFGIDWAWFGIGGAFVLSWGF